MFKFILVSAFLVLCAMSSKRSARGEFCNTTFPKFELIFNEAELALRKDPELSRSLASIKEPELSDEEKSSWKDWAELNLKKFQHDTDVLEEDPTLKSARSRISDAASRLVMFYGYALRGKPEMMRRELREAQSILTQTKKQICQPRSHL